MSRTTSVLLVCTVDCIIASVPDDLVNVILENERVPRCLTSHVISTKVQWFMQGQR